MKTREQTPLTLLREHRPAAIRGRLAREPRPQYVSDAILGGIDGCVSTFAVVSGAVGAGFTSSVALILGFANLVADGFSMAISNYESGKAEKDHVESIRRVEEEHIDKIPEGEREEVRQIFQKKGFEGETLAKIVETITEDRGLWVETMLQEEHGLHKSVRNPVRSSITTFAAFIVVGAVPLIPFFNATLATRQKYVVSSILAGVMFFLIGVLKSLSSGKPVLKAGMRTLLTGGAAASLAFAIGYVLRRFIEL